MTTVHLGVLFIGLFISSIGLNQMEILQDVIEPSDVLQLFSLQLFGKFPSSTYRISIPVKMSMEIN